MRIRDWLFILGAVGFFVWFSVALFVGTTRANNAQHDIVCVATATIYAGKATRIHPPDPGLFGHGAVWIFYDSLGHRVTHNGFCLVTYQ